MLQLFIVSYESHTGTVWEKYAKILKPELFPTFATVPKQDKQRCDLMNNQQPCTAFKIYLLTAIGLSPGGSTHLHTNNT
jgi:hypothetical protein